MSSCRIPGPQGTFEFPKEQHVSFQKNLATNEITIKGVSAGWAGWEISLRGKTGLRLSGENFYVTGRPQPGMWVPKSGSTTKLFIYKASNPKKVFRLDYHALQSTSGRPTWHYNTTKGFANIVGLVSADHAVTPGAVVSGRILTIFRWGGRAMFIVGAAMSAYEIYHAENKAREIMRQTGGWTGAITAGRYCASAGAKLGAGVMVAAGQFGPQVAVPEELVTVPIGTIIGGAVGGVSCGVIGWFAGTEITETVYDWIFKPLEKEEWIIFPSEEKI